MFPAAHHTPEMVASAKAEIRNNRDVVYMKTANEADWNERYRSEIFRHPLVSSLRWFEINAVYGDLKIDW